MEAVLCVYVEFEVYACTRVSLCVYGMCMAACEAVSACVWLVPDKPAPVPALQGRRLFPWRGATLATACATAKRRPRGLTARLAVVLRRPPWFCYSLHPTPPLWGGCSSDVELVACIYSSLPVGGMLFGVSGLLLLIYIHHHYHYHRHYQYAFG